MLLTGCGGFLPFFGDDDDPAPAPPPPTSDAASETSTIVDATAFEAASDGAPPLFWSCTTQPPSRPYGVEVDCNGDRLRQVCDSNPDLPIGLPCDSFGQEQTYCPQVCQKTAPGSSQYSYTLTTCRCQP